MGASRDAKPTMSPKRARQLDFDPQSFVNVGSWLNAQERRPKISASTQTAAPPTSRPGRGMVVVLLAVVAVLLGTNAYAYNEYRGWKAERSVLQSKISNLESEASRAGRAQDPPYAADVHNTACPGGELLDTCWFKVGFGNCAKDALGDPIGRVEGAWRLAWDATADVIVAVGETIVNDVNQFGKGVHSFGSAAFNFLGLPCGSA